ncbi:xylose isomerase-like protein [Tilletiaria anomala UBC 951]|uniref:Xylose isomerase-like protein n=1 Tax=Tilletiaria anomala (strain ATCC 24038 / CBS 436.72 / UBC 951) TaxID=1037660 RepID=A0A066VXD7_TILAU|nr:xylose isomerase-like protein [Tilletiaria anomala UBC 951]KDN44943.1 xylose isomerase-like protein [Tilletiaria anomala UBC 951]
MPAIIAPSATPDFGPQVSGKWALSDTSAYTSSLHSSLAASASVSSLDATHARHPLDGFDADAPAAQLPRGIMSLSLGAADKHAIEAKITACVAQGWQGIEIHIDDIKAKARSLAGQNSRNTMAEPAREHMLLAASAISAMCKASGLKVICLEPILHYPGILPISRRDERLHELPLWFEISDILDTDLIQVASAMFGSSSSGVYQHTGDEERVIQDLRLLAHAGQRWHTRCKFFAYEAMCFGSFVTTWQQAWRQVQLVDAHNFGMVLDTMQILGGAIADPSRPDGLVDGWSEKLDADLKELKETFADARSRRKLFLLQLGDAALPPEPMHLKHPLFDPTQHANTTMAWARAHRAFAGEGYLPVEELSRVIFNDIRYRGWVSAEYFNLDLQSPSTSFPFEAAKRCNNSHELVLKRLEHSQTTPKHSA